MTSRAVFTIVTSNYIPMANILGDSIMLNQPNTDFMVFVINGFDKKQAHCKSKYTSIFVEDLGFDRLIELAFKYDLMELCTAIKPKCFNHVFSLGYEKVLFFDPDIYIFSTLESIFKSLDNHFIVLTPHILFPEENYTGHWPQGRLLAAGIFNLGFAGISMSEKTPFFLKWWDKNLSESCFSERREGLFTDQKWMNCCPVYFPDTKILRDLGNNIALWNIHEREIVQQGELLHVKKRNSEDQTLHPVCFFHFSNFLFRQAESDFADFLPFSLNHYPDVLDLVKFYRSKLVDSNFVQFNKLPDYKFNYFTNGVHINKIHRRLYRRLLQNGVSFDNPFNSEEGSFYSILKKNKLVVEEKLNFDTVHLRSTNKSSTKFRFMIFSIRFLVKVIGVKRYTFLCRFLFWLTKYENQLFLIKEYDYMVSDKAPNAYINLNGNI